MSHLDCEQYQQQLQDWVDGYLSDSGKQSLRGHVADCSRCKQEVRALRHLKQSLKELPTMTINEQRMQNAIRKAERYQPRESFYRGWLKPVVVFCALFTIVVLLNGMQPEDDVVNFPQVSLAVGETRVVNMVFRVPQALDKVRFVVHLPESVELNGFPQKRLVSWTDSLGTGENLLALPVTAQSKLSGQIVAELFYKDNVRRFQVKLAVEDGGTRRSIDAGMRI